MGRYRIKISSAWYSEDYIILRYSTNGIFWKSVKYCKEEILEGWYYMETKVNHFNDAKDLLQEFNSLEKVKQYEANERAKLKKYNAETTERRRLHKEKRKNIYTQYG